jgi:hypothetical protein
MNINNLAADTPVKTCLGIGDLLVLKMLYNKYNLNNDIIINTHIVQKYRNSSITYLNFIKWLTEHLFVGNNIVYVYMTTIDTVNFNNYTLDAASIISIQKYFELDNMEFIHNICSPSYYIVFHTKCRFPGDNKSVFDECKTKIKSFMNNYKSKYKIVLLGERNIENNSETHVNGIESIYDTLTLLKNNNDIIDLTVETLLTSPDIQLFQNDIRIIHNAKTNIGLGYGGNFVIVTAFAKKFDFFVGTISHIYLTNISCCNNKNMNLYNNIDNFLECIKTY